MDPQNSFAYSEVEDLNLFLRCDERLQLQDKQFKLCRHAPSYPDFVD
jgi:hypothetical protein